MNYDQAYAGLRHARTKSLLQSKNLCNATKLKLVMGEAYVHPNGLRVGVVEHHVSLELFNKVILTWKPNGNIVLTSAGYKTITTRDRFKRYLPQGFQVWQDYPYWYIRTPAGTMPFRDGMELNDQGVDCGMPPEFNRGIPNLKDRVHKYAQFYAARLVNGVIPQGYRASPAQYVSSDVADCYDCRQLAGAKAEAVHKNRAHLLEHVQSETTPASLARVAVEHALADSPGFDELPRTFMREVIDASWYESQLVWRKPRTKKALITQTELKMLRTDLPRLDIIPRYYIRNLRALLEEFLLEALGFELMDAREYRPRGRGHW
jgi:hypothetical protein